MDRSPEPEAAVPAAGPARETNESRGPVARTSARLHGRRRVPVAVLLAAAVAAGVPAWLLTHASAAPPAAETVDVVRGDVVLSVGGVGQIVPAGAPAAQIAVPGSAAASSGGGSTSAAPADAVFASSTGHVSRILVSPGAHVAGGQPIAVLDDGGAAASAVAQAENELSTAELELRQKQTSDPANGLRATPAELAAAGLAVGSAKENLARLVRGARPADVSAARLEVQRAEADLETLTGGTAEDRYDAIRTAEAAVETAKQRLLRLFAPASPADVAAAKAELAKARSDLAVLQRPPQGAAPDALGAAQDAVNVARQALAEAQAASPPDPAAVRAAKLDLDRALADLATLQQAPPGPLSEEIDAARAAVDAAQAKLDRLEGPPDPVEAAAAEQELISAMASVRRLEAGPTPLNLAAARQAVAASKAKLAQLVGPPARSDVTAARLEIRKAEADLALLRARGGPASDFDQELAVLRVRAARAHLASARLAQRLLTVRALHGGVVTDVLTVAGAPADATTPVATVVRLDRLEAAVQLSEFDIARVTPGLRAVVKIDALGGRPYLGTVAFAAPVGSDNGGVVTYPVRIALPKAAGRGGGPRPGMNASVRIILASHADVLELPVDAVAHDSEDRPVVTVVDGSGRSSTKHVLLGLANNKDVEIVRGLRQGEHVLLPTEGAQGD